MKNRIGRIRLQVALDCSAYSFETFILNHIELRSTIATDALQCYSFIDESGYCHEKTNQSKTRNYMTLYSAHLVTSLVKRLIRGTFQGRFEPKYLQNYLDEYVFRFNRRKSMSIGKIFMQIIQQVVHSTKITGSGIKWDMDLLSEHFVTLAFQRTGFIFFGLSCCQRRYL